MKGRTVLRRVMKHIDKGAEAIYTNEYSAYNILRNTREKDRTRRAAAIAISALTNIEEEPCTISFI